MLMLDLLIEAYTPVCKMYILEDARWNIDND